VSSAKPPKIALKKEVNGVKESSKAASSKLGKVSRGDAALVVQHVMPLGNGWVVKTNNTSKFFLITDSKKEAVDVARKLARTKKSELIVHSKDGNIQVRESYA
jgi:hypothetical protein